MKKFFFFLISISITGCSTNRQEIEYFCVKDNAKYSFKIITYEKDFSVSNEIKKGAQRIGAELSNCKVAE